MMEHGPGVRIQGREDYNGSLEIAEGESGAGRLLEDHTKGRSRRGGGDNPHQILKDQKSRLAGQLPLEGGGGRVANRR